MTRDYSFNYGRGRQCVRLDPAQVIAEIRPHDVAATGDPRAELRRALENPVGSPRLRDLAAAAGGRVVLVCSDFTRPPSALMIGAAAEEIRRGGVDDERIAILFAPGMHRLMTDEEMKRLAGKENFSRYTCVQHDARAPESCVSLGFTSRGTPIEVNRLIHEAGLVVLTGYVEPSYLAGFTGGRKSVMPGLASEKAINLNHRLLMEPGTCIGRMAGNHINEDALEFARRVGVDFILNQVINNRDEMTAAVAGDMEEAHQIAVERSGEIYRVPRPAEADIVISTPGGYPYDVDMVQGKKAVIPAVELVRPGGVIILVIECAEGWGAEAPFRKWITGMSPEDILKRIRNEFVLGGHGAYLLVRPAAEKKAALMVVSRHSAELKDSFIQGYSDLATAVETARKMLKKHPTYCLVHDARRIILAHPEVPC